MAEDKLKWQHQKELGLKTNVMGPMLQALKEVLQEKRNELEVKLRSLKMLGVVSMDKKVNFSEIDKKLGELK